MASDVTSGYALLPPSHPPFVQSKDPTTQKTSQTTVTCMYQMNVAGFWRNVTVLWSKNVMNYTLIISVNGAGNDVVYTCKIDLKPWHFWAKKGYKTFEVDGNQLEAYWDFKSAKFSGSPEPTSDYYVAIVSDQEVVLLVGDCKKKAYTRTKARPALAEAMLLYKKENVFGKRSFSTRSQFEQGKREHDIIIESSTTGPKEPEMWISIDGIVLIHVANLQWKFRGNQTVAVDGQPIEVFWDVYKWLFCGPGSGNGLFIFKSGPEGESDDEGGRCDDDSECSSHSRYCSVKGSSQFFLFLYAWMVE